MTLIEIILLGFALAADAVSVAAGIGLVYNRRRQIFRISFHFGLFQGLFPYISASIGEIVFHLIDKWDHWVVFGVLTFLGGRMIYQSGTNPAEKAKQVDPTRKWTMVGLSIAVSIDALGAGLSLVDAKVSLLTAAAIIGFTTAALTAGVMLLAKRARFMAAGKMEFAGGVILILIGVRALVEHL